MKMASKDKGVWNGHLWVISRRQARTRDLLIRSPTLYPSGPRARCLVDWEYSLINNEPLPPSDGADHDEDDEHCRVFSSCCGNVVSSASSSLSDRNSSDEEARARHMARTEDRMRQRLLDFYLTPWERWHKKGVFPFKMVTQFVKLLAITAQLILFGSLNSTRVSYGERAVIAFKHLYLIDWDPQYETLPYPPSTGIYSVYTRERFYESIGFAIEQFNLTEEMTISGYSFADRNRTMQFCLNQVVHSGLQIGNYSTDNCNCVSVSVLGVPVEEVKTAEAVKNFLAAHNIIVDFMRLQTFRLNFQLSSPSIHHLDWDRSVECFQFNISVSFLSCVLTAAPFNLSAQKDLNESFLILRKG
ncbi:unnamed protein product [Schistocephalus solidus]|uniref:Mucolipin-3 n=1 Tax=Schistocephalus solidus TaxID=70667 RepID=A0A183TKP8_SCHSO|nr:unnamed protein product [Schistocephalus solidus]